MTLSYNVSVQLASRAIVKKRKDFKEELGRKQPNIARQRAGHSSQKLSTEWKIVL